MKTQNENLNRKSQPLIVAVSILIPVAVALMFTVKIEGYDTSFLPPIYASLNAVTSLLLIGAVVAIKKKQQILHRRLMTTAVVLSALFLVLYLIYHSTSNSTPYGGEGLLRGVYFFILISHILLSIVVVPFVLITYMRGHTGQYAKHKKIARVAFPLWLYVSMSGVAVYLLISPYYV